MSMHFIDIDECTSQLDNCHENAACNNTFGGFECNCNAGFEGDGVNCTSKLVTFSGYERTECSVCATYMVIFVSTVYMHVWSPCIIQHAFIQLADINECELETYPCHFNASCTDTEGTFNCTCNEGFEGNGLNCTGTIK